MAEIEYQVDEMLLCCRSFYDGRDRVPGGWDVVLQEFVMAEIEYQVDEMLCCRSL